MKIATWLLGIYAVYALVHDGYFAFIGVLMIGGAAIAAVKLFQTVTSKSSQQLPDRDKKIDPPSVRNQDK